ncbi:MAG: hypothetical protein Q9168_007210 [Polycauliona sp. 1 TL-2023]
MAGSLAHTFLWKKDEEAERKCKMWAGIVKAVIMAVTTILASAAAPAAIPAVAAGETIAIEAAETASVVIARASPWRFVENAASGVQSYWKSGGAQQAELGISFASNFAQVAGDPLEKAMCKNVANPPDDYEAEALLKIQGLINDQMQDYRSVIEKTSADTLRGVGFGEAGAVKAGDTTMLAEMLHYGDYLDLELTQSRRFITEPTLIERDIKTHFKNALISVILEEQMCFIQCSSYKPSPADDTNFDIDGRHCEAKCWQNWNSEKELSLFGLDKLVQAGNEWDITLDEFLKASYDHHKGSGIGKGPMAPSVKDLFDATGTSTSGSYLPVCDTYFPSELDNDIPCRCGDEYGSETLAFWKEAHFDEWMAETDRDQPLKVAKRICTKNLLRGQTLPVEYFLNLCNMDFHWPSRLEGDRLGGDLLDGKDHLCGEFQEAVNSYQSHPEYPDSSKPEQLLDLSCHMCFHDPVGDNVALSQLMLADTDYGQSFETACEALQGLCP